MRGHSPVSTLLGCSPPPSSSLRERQPDACDVSRARSRSSPSSGVFYDSGSGIERIKKGSGAPTSSDEEKETPAPPVPSFSSSSSSASASLAARRARVLGANVATVDASLPPIVAGRGCHLFAELIEDDDDDDDEEPAATAAADEEPAAAAAAAAAADDDDDQEPAADESGGAATEVADGGTGRKARKKRLVPYLDCQNNVAHLGHSHPAVAAAVSRAFSTLNTNSRYLHADLVAHAEQLVALLSSPPPSSSSSPSSSSAPSGASCSSFVEDPVVYYVPSGTEANDLALRIARAFHEERAEEESREKSSSPHRHRHHYLALEGAYHGHAGEPARVSSYVHFGGAVGSPCPADVSLLHLPDSVRDGDKSSPPDPAPAVRAAAAEAHRASSSPSSSSSSSSPSSPSSSSSSSSPSSSSSSSSLTAFIFESFPSCAGQVLLPRGWLAAAVAAAREDAERRRRPPPVVIADEVQTGLGRLGPLESGSFWAFQHFGVPSPDIVTLGKPAANGFPFGAVVASRRVAAAFARRHPPFFSTFGGCTAAAAAALATLGALRGERLPERAAEVGARLLAGLREMAASLLLERDGRLRRSGLLLDVRGVGLMLGVEVAFSRGGSSAAAAAAAAPRVAAFVAAHCRAASRVLVSADGAGPRAGSVLKIKPPLCFGLEEARELVAALRAGFGAVPAELLLLPEEEGAAAAVVR